MSKKRADKQKKRAKRSRKQAANPADARLDDDAIEAELLRSHDALRAGRPDQAERIARKALRGAPDHPKLLANLTAALEQLGRPKEALVVAERLAAVHGDFPEAHGNLGILQRFVGDLEGARASFERAVALAPDYVAGWRNLTTVKRYSDPGDPDLAHMEALVADAPPAARAMLHFALGKALDDVGRYDDAFAHMERGNRHERARRSYSREGFSALVDATIEAFGRDFVEGPVSPRVSPASPILVVGMPRSGSTLVEQVLASHPSVAALGEIPDLNAVVRARAAARVDLRSASPDELADLGRAYVRRLSERASDADRFVDKALDNGLNVGLLARALPGARFVHVVRSSTAQVFSIYRTLFASPLPFAYDFGDIVHHGREMGRLMAHWDALRPGSVLTVRYEDLVADFEAEARRVYDHCGLTWDERALRFHETERPVASASATQVRQPLFKSGVDHWRRYERHLAGVAELLGE